MYILHVTIRQFMTEITWYEEKYNYKCIKMITFASYIYSKKSSSNFIKIKLEGLLLIQSITDLYLPTKLIKL